MKKLNITKEAFEKSQYFKNSVANFLHDGTWGATAVIVYEDEQEKSRIEDDARR